MLGLRFKFLETAISDVCCWFRVKKESSDPAWVKAAGFGSNRIKSS